MEPSAGSIAASGVVDAHGPGVQEVGVDSGVQFAYKCCESFLLVFGWSGVEGDVCDVLPQGGVDVVGGGL